MRAYYMDEDPSDQRLPHDSGVAVPEEILDKLGVLRWYIPVDAEGKWESQVDVIADERSYRNRDIVFVTKEGMGDQFEANLKKFYHEHMHEDEEIRYIIEGGGYFDVRESPTDSWIRLHLGSGDMIVLPAGIYHRFGLDTNMRSRTMRLFKDEPKWIAHYRGEHTDTNPFRIDYLKNLQSNGVAVGA
ncbi:Acireductone dioxygenase ARD family [Rhodofomes roseus]|uniref:Acireductone dioxygenase n=1 Tax=Rhodofomes roseus TaxID=34475 RepID=A0ABQ8KQ61_9APHY|nr:Acireductone dioxygenase ARD family [Rhodofomes roseus]KAH9840553.1 Acireductone dioxygenase ARD family [Rhodofomes roseus]